MRASQHIQSHGYFAFPVDGDELSFKAGKGAFYDFYGIAGSQRDAAHFHCFGAVVEHEAELRHLFVGNDGGSTFTAQHHIAADSLQA